MEDTLADLAGKPTSKDNIFKKVESALSRFLRQKDANGNDIINAWFVGFAPFDDPEIAVVGMVENGGHGYYVAEVVKEIISEYFGMNVQEVNEDVSANAETEYVR